MSRWPGASRHATDTQRGAAGSLPGRRLGKLSPAERAVSQGAGAGQGGPRAGAGRAPGFAEWLGTHRLTRRTAAGRSRASLGNQGGHSRQGPSQPGGGDPCQSDGDSSPRLGGAHSARRLESRSVVRWGLAQGRLAPWSVSSEVARGGRGGRPGWSGRRFLSSRISGAPTRGAPSSPASVGRTRAWTAGGTL